MKTSLKTIYTYLISLILAAIGFIPFIVAAVFYNDPTISVSFDHYIYAILSYMALIIIAGWIIGDIYGMRYRKKNDDWGQEYPESVKNTLWKIRMPILLAIIILLIFVIVLTIFLLINGCYPFANPF